MIDLGGLDTSCAQSTGSGVTETMTLRGLLTDWARLRMAMTDAATAAMVETILTGLSRQMEAAPKP